MFVLVITRMIQLFTYTHGDFEFEQLAQITTTEGTLIVDWIPSSKETLVTYRGQVWKGQNEEIGSTLARLLEVDRVRLVPSDLRIFESHSPSVQGTQKMLKDLLDCEWSDYACDKMAFQCHVLVISEST